MKIRNTLVGLVLLIAVGGLGYLGERYLVLSQHACDICGREISAKLQATLFLKDNTRADACCPRCALHFDLQKPGQVARMTVNDSLTGEPVDAKEATYVEGSDAEMCHPAAEAAKREPGMQYDVKFDRCLPSLIAYKDKSAALLSVMCPERVGRPKSTISSSWKICPKESTTIFGYACAPLLTILLLIPIYDRWRVIYLLRANSPSPPEIG